MDLFDGDHGLAAHIDGDAARLILATLPERRAQDVERHPRAVVAAKVAR